MDAAASSIARASVIAVDPIAATQRIRPEAGVAVRLTSPAPPPADLDDALVDVAEAGLTYRANAKVVYGSDRLIGALLDAIG
jgi:hypothetical protein